MINIRPLNDCLRKKAKEELNEVENRIPEDIEALRSWIAKQPHLKARTDDQFLVSFLRGCKYSLEKAKSKIDFYYTIKTMMPELFANMKIDKSAIEMCRAGTYVRLPKPLRPDGPCIQITSFSRLDQSKYGPTEFFRYMMLRIEMHNREDDNGAISGYVEVIDLSKITLGFVTKINALLAQKMTIFGEKASPMRLKGIHFLNCPKEAQAIFLLIRSLMSEKLKQRFFIHKNIDELYQHVPQEYLPAEYGGKNGNIPDIQIEDVKNLMKFNDYFIEEQNYGVDEKLRVGKKVDSETMFGIEGSFRKLEID